MTNNYQTDKYDIFARQYPYSAFHAGLMTDIYDLQGNYLFTIPGFHQRLTDEDIDDLLEKTQRINIK